VSAGGQSFALDSTSVEAIKRIAEDDLRSIEGRDVVLLENGPVPILQCSKKTKERNRLGRMSLPRRRILAVTAELR
jgi:chemotaxis protein histidine kinase CheA